MSETQPLKLPGKTRVALKELYLKVLEAQKDFQGPLAVAYDFLGLDPNLNHQVNFETGVVTPAAPATEPTPIRAEA